MAPRSELPPIARDPASELARHDRWLRAVVLARVTDPHAVDDVMAEVAVAAARPHALPDRPGEISPWLYRVAVRQALLHRRRMGRRANLEQQYAESLPPHSDATRDPDPLDWLLADEQRTLVRKALHRLSRRDAELLLLKYTQEWSYRQIAAHLGVSQSAVEARLHRARKRLRSALAVFDSSLIVSR